MRIAIVAGEVYDLETMVGDVSSTYLEAFAKEKVYKCKTCVALPKFGQYTEPLSEGRNLFFLFLKVGTQNRGQKKGTERKIFGF